jgi:hypothetical protein
VVAPIPSFSLIGRVLDGSVAMAIVRDGERVSTLRSGDRVAGFRVVAVGEDDLTLQHEATALPVRLAYGQPAGAAGRAPAVLSAAAPDASPEAARND